MFLQILFFVAILALLGILVKQAREQRLAVIGLAVLIACLPLDNFWDINMPNFQDISIGVSSALVVLAFILNKSRQFTWQPIFFLIVSIYLLNFVGLLHTGDFSLANKRIDTMTPVIVFPVLFGMIQLAKRNVILLLRFFLWTVIAVCVYGLLSYAVAIDDFSWKMILLEGKRYAYLFTVGPIAQHPSALSIVLLMALPVSLYLRYHDGKQITRVEMLLAIVLPILVAFMVGARIAVAIFPVLLSLGYLFYCKFKQMLKWSLVALGVVALGVAIFLLPADIRERYSDPIRIDLRHAAVSAIKEKPILGWGTWQQTNFAMCEKRTDAWNSAAYRFPDHFHNVYLDYMMQFGIVGIAILLGLIFWIFGIAIREKNFLLLSFVMMYVIIFYFDNVLQSPRFVVAFMFWFCFLIANRKYLVERKTTMICQTNKK